MPVIRTTLHINAPVEVCFNLARSIDIHMQSASHTKEKAVAGVLSGLIELGQTVTWEAVHLGIKQSLTAVITEMDYPQRFVDEQVRGAFKRFKHIHEFIEEGNGRTLMVDTFDYDSPFGLLGRMADKLFLESYMRRFLEQRNRFIKQAAEPSEFIQPEV